MKALSIPKLELRAALLATRLKDDTLKARIVKINHVCMWTVSTTVLQWLNTSDKYMYLSLTVMAKSWSPPLLMSGTNFWAAITQLIPVRWGFLRKPSKLVAGFLVRAFSWLLTGCLYPTNVWSIKFVNNDIFYDFGNFFETSYFFVNDVTFIKNPELGINWKCLVPLRDIKELSPLC